MRNYVYDALHRLTDAEALAPDGLTVASASGYGYDLVGNRTARSITDPLLTATETYGYDAFSNRLLSSVSTSGENRSITHTDSGNRSADMVVGGLANKDFILAYDATDRLTGVSNAGIPLGAYVHNAMGQRVAKTVGVATTHYLYDLSGRLIAEADGATGATTAEYIAFEGINLAFITTTGIYWVHADHLGTPQVLTDATGVEAWSALYSPFGLLLEETGPLDFNLRFPGQYHDRETGYYYNYYRTYDPTSGRYVESDPIGLQGGWNTYEYAGWNPVRYIDPRGLTAGEKPNYSICEYYKIVGATSGCTYHAFAYRSCRDENDLVNFFTGLCLITNTELNCIRNCLAKKDAKAQQDPQCQTGQGDCKGTGCTKKTCIDQYHDDCFISCGVSKWCYGGNYGPYPNDG